MRKASETITHPLTGKCNRIKQRLTYMSTVKFVKCSVGYTVWKKTQSNPIKYIAVNDFPHVYSRYT